MKKLQKDSKIMTEIPDLSGVQFRFIRREMGVYQRIFSQLFNKQYEFTRRIEKRRRVEVYHVKALCDYNPELFFAAYKIWQDKNKTKDSDENENVGKK